MARPILNNIGTFDATKNKTISFQCHGAILSKCNISIYDARTDILVYSLESDIIRNKYTSILPANSLDNEMQYYANMVTYDIHGNMSVKSNTIYFNCEISPEFELDIENNTILDSSAIEVNIIFDHYSDRLKTIVFYLADEEDKILTKSKEILYETDEDLHYKFIGLNNNTTYKVYATCVTTNGLELETNKKIIRIQCDSPSYGGECYVETNNNAGYVKCSTYFVIIQYNGEKTFEFKDSLINLKNTNMYYDEGFEISGDFKLCLKAKGTPTGHKLLMLESRDGEITLDFNYYEDETVEGYKFRLMASYGELKSINYSSAIQMSDDKFYEFWIIRKNHLYDIEVKEITE